MEEKRKGIATGKDKGLGCRMPGGSLARHCQPSRRLGWPAFFLF
jgi:hypothetical protein